MHSKNIRVKKSGSFENDPIWVKYPSSNPLPGQIPGQFYKKIEQKH
jgi:hypothetical protein